MLLRLYNDESPLIDHSQEHRPNPQGSKEAIKNASIPASEGGESGNGHHEGEGGHDGNTSSEDERAVEGEHPTK